MVGWGENVAFARLEGGFPTISSVTLYISSCCVALTHCYRVSNVIESHEYSHICLLPLSWKWQGWIQYPLPARLLCPLTFWPSYWTFVLPEWDRHIEISAYKISTICNIYLFLHFGLMLSIILLLLSFRFRHWLLSTLRLLQFSGSKRSKALCTWAKPSRSRWVTSWLRPKGFSQCKSNHWPFNIQFFTMRSIISIISTFILMGLLSINAYAAKGMCLFLSIGQWGRQNGVNSFGLGISSTLSISLYCTAPIVTLSQKHYHGNICIIDFWYRLPMNFHQPPFLDRELIIFAPSFSRLQRLHNGIQSRYFR